MNKPEYISQQFSFPHYLDITHKQNSDALKDILFRLYEACGLEIPEVFDFRNPLDLQIAINLISEPESRAPSMSFYNSYAAFYKTLHEPQVNTTAMNQWVWEWVTGKVAGEVSRLAQDATEIGKRMKVLSPFVRDLETEIQLDLTSKLNCMGLKFIDWAFHPTFRDRVWINAQRLLLDRASARVKDYFNLLADAVDKGLMYAFLTRDMVLWCPLPQLIKTDETLYLHNETGPSLLWEGDYALYHWHGVKVFKRLIEYPETIKQEEVMQERDVERKRCMQEKLGIGL
ncbi:MAG TPA: hypothetical protein DCG19_05275 [Cryomorphaceae bacterium]|nr:hypothetical protein [Owenweeksia sp.]MBF97893.1 hypothetical protein [Owenweeksia sp.]HAD96796.1 hypothetical protein [Cryomorphaceae bacterium]|tara:strand:- start:4339 stop:5196 length:858 start_codon:yes stop_codon:yes gene_type:complete